MPAPAFAADSDQQVKTVRVGWLVNNKGFQEGMPGSRGGATVPRALSYYTRGWQYEYVSGTFSSLWTCSKQAKSTSCPTSRIRQNASEAALFLRTPRHQALLHLRQARPRRSGQGDPRLKASPSAALALAMQTIVGQQWLADEGVTCTYKEIDTGSALLQTTSDGIMLPFRQLYDRRRSSDERHQRRHETIAPILRYYNPCST